MTHPADHIIAYLLPYISIIIYDHYLFIPQTENTESYHTGYDIFYCIKARIQRADLTLCYHFEITTSFDTLTLRFELRFFNPTKARIHDARSNRHLGTIPEYSPIYYATYTTIKLMPIILYQRCDLTE